MVRRMKLAFGAIALAAAALTTTAPAQAAGVTVGNLTCSVASGFGFIFGSSRALNCTFAGANGFYDHYTGSISKFGVDIGYTRAGVIIWTVVAPSAKVGPGALVGNYVGGTASATVGVGIGANALIGGSGNSIALQPVSIEGSRGLNVAAGIGAITLHHHR